METTYLPRGLDAFDDSEADHDPSHQQRQRHFPVETACVLDGAGDVESLAVPEVSGGRALLTLRLDNYDRKETTGMVMICGSMTQRPRKSPVRKSHIYSLWTENIVKSVKLGQVTLSVEKDTHTKHIGDTLRESICIGGFTTFYFLYFTFYNILWGHSSHTFIVYAHWSDVTFFPK